MQRFSNTLLTLALTALITAVSLLLIAAAWLVATHALSRPPLLKGLFLSGFLLVGTQLNAQIVLSTSLVLIEGRSAYSPHEVPFYQAILPDTLPVPVRMMPRAPRRIIRSNPTWPADEPPMAETPASYPYPIANRAYFPLFYLDKSPSDHDQLLQTRPFIPAR